MVEIKHIFRIVLLGLSLLTVTNFAHAATITATVDRHQINEGESFQLTLEVKGDADGSPDFSPLQTNFEILSRNKSSSMQIINGSISSKLVWVLSLMPKQKGQLTIPPIAFGADHSNSVNINVSKTRTSPSSPGAQDIFLQVSAQPTQAYVQAQIIYTVRVYISTNVTNASLSEPSLSDADAVIEKLGKDSRFETDYQGRHYQVIERRYAIFPQQSGKLQVAPVVFNAQLAQASPFGMSLFPQYGQTKRIQSKAIEININPIPGTQSGTTWLPAKHIRLQEDWSQNPLKFKVGEAVTRTLTLAADGLTAAQLPQIAVDTPAEFKTYPDQPLLNDKKNDNGVTGMRQEKIAMIATKPGHYELPAIKISWWNTETHQLEIAHIAKRQIDVAAADGSSNSPTNTTPKNDSAPSPVNKPSIAPLPSTSSENHRSAGFWPWLSLILAIGWLGTMGFMWRQGRRNTQAPPKTRDLNTQQGLTSRKLAQQNLKRACLENDANATKQALLAWGKTLYADKNLNSLRELGAVIGGPIADHISTLNQALYSPSAKDWEGQRLWNAIQEQKPGEKKTRPKKNVDLAPLFPQ